MYSLLFSCFFHRYSWDLNWKVCRKKKLHRCFCSILTIAVMLQHISLKIFRWTKLFFFTNIILPSSFGGGRYRMPGWDQYNGTDPRTYKVIWNYCWVGYSKLFGFPGIIQKNRYIPSYKTWNICKKNFF